MTKLINNNTLDIKEINKLSQKPPIFTPGVELFWDDEHISKGMLGAHLSQYTDAASRRAETIEKTVEFLSEYLKLDDEKAILDLGCGPGLYCSRFYNRCKNVTGMDFSKRSIEYAVNYARENKLDVKYLYSNYLNMDFNEEFDAAFLIYCDLGALFDSQRDNLLDRAYKALKTGGYFVFDVFTKYNKEGWGEGSSWYAGETGFWKPYPHMVLENKYHYPEQDTYLNQYIVVDEMGKAEVYRVYNHYYSKESITGVLEQHGFTVEAVWSDLQGNPYFDECPCLGIAARKK